VKIPFEMMKA